LKGLRILSIFKEISSADVKNARSFLNQLIDILQQDVSGSSTRRKYQQFVMKWLIQISLAVMHSIATF
jgi:hypothetical protein